MSMLVRWTPSALTAEQYDEAIGKLEAQGDWPPDGARLPRLLQRERDAST